MKRVAGTAISLALVLGCVTGTMLVGAALKSPCASGNWGDLRQYHDLCYSDIVPLLGTEQLEGSDANRLPFINPCRTVPGQNCDEYPVLTMYFMRVAAWFSGNNYARFYYVNAALLFVCALLITFFLYLMAGRRALYFALAPTLLVYGTMNWDLFAVAFATGGLLYLFNRRDGTAGAMLGLGAAAKLYPGMLGVPFIAQRLRDRRPDAAIKVGWATLGTWVLVNLPFALASPTSWFRFYLFNKQRAPDFDSLWYIGCRHFPSECLSTNKVNLLSVLLFVGAFVLVWGLRALRFPDFPRWTLGFPLIALFLVTNKVYSPQYSLWLLPWFALALPGLRRFAAFEVADVAVFVTRFWWFGKYQVNPLASPGWFEAMVVVRTCVLLWCVGAWVWKRHEPLSIETLWTERGARAALPDPPEVDPEVAPA
jgi:uncharacterized membrane protein